MSQNPPNLQKNKGGKPPKHGLSGTPTYNSWKEAKNRCNNPKSPDYPNYGGKGIKFLFGGPDELVADIGLRPDGKTLDRINPEGHYEAGNVRWANAKTQATNKSKPFDREAYKTAVQHWKLAIAFLNNPTLVRGANLEVLKERYAATGLPYANFEPFEPSKENLGKTYICLPSLLHPGNRVVLKGGPFPERLNARPNTEFLVGMQDFQLSLNCCEQECDAFDRFVLSSKTGTGYLGLLFTGAPDHGDNGIEGRMLAMASKLARFQRPSRTLTTIDLKRRLTTDDPDDLSVLHTPGILFLPDLDVWPRLFGHDNRLNGKLSDVLEYRAKQRLPTVVYTHTSEVRVTRIRSLFASDYREVNLSKSIPPAHNPPTIAGHKLDLADVAKRSKAMQEAMLDELDEGS